MKFKRGDKFPFTVRVVDADGNAVDITGATVFFTVRTTEQPTSSDDSDATIHKTQATHSSPSGGITSFTLTEEDTNKTPGKYYREIQIKFSNGNILSASTGALTIEQDLTKNTS